MASLDSGVGLNSTTQTGTHPLGKTFTHQDATQKPTEEERLVSNVAIEAIERSIETIQTTTHSRITLGFVTRPKQDFYFSINYNGYKAPVAVEKMQQLSRQASTHLNTIFAQIDARITRREDYINQGGETNRTFMDELNSFRAQKRALENMTDFEFITKKVKGEEEKVPHLKVNYINPTTNNKKILTFSLASISHGSQLAILKHIDQLQDEFNQLVIEKNEAINDGGEELWNTSPKGQRYKWLLANVNHLFESDNYTVSIDGDETLIHISENLVGQNYYYPHVVADHIVPHMEGKQLNLIGFYGSVGSIFEKVIEKNKRFAQESGYHDYIKAINPDAPSHIGGGDQNRLIQAQQMMQMAKGK